MVFASLLALAEPISRADVFYVNGNQTNAAQDGLSWSTAFTNVQSGINTAAIGDEVWVAAAVYPENLALKDGVALYGGFNGSETALAQRNWISNVVTLDGRQSGSVIVLAVGATNSPRIDGFTIRNGKASFGGGIWCSNSSPVIANNSIIQNTAGPGTGSRAGGGIFAYRGFPVITNNVIAGNSADSGGGIECRLATSSIINNRILNNTAAIGLQSQPPSGGGGGVNIQYGTAQIANNFFFANLVTNQPAAINRLGYGGGLLLVADANVVNNTFLKNWAEISPSDNGGAIYCVAPTNVLIANNLIALGSSGVQINGTSPPIVLRNNCVFANGDFNYQGVSDPTGTNGNISVDPKLAGYYDVHLSAGSPCIDAGDVSIVSGSEDIDGRPRVFGSSVDIGADEYDGTAFKVPANIFRVSADGNDGNDGSSWTQAKKTIQSALDAAFVAGGEVWVKAGTYFENVRVRTHAYLYGGFAGTEAERSQRNWIANPTILDGAGKGPVVSAVPVGPFATVSGFTIQHGMFKPGLGAGGGVSCVGSPLIANNRIISNLASNFEGGGIYCWQSSAVIINNFIAGNEARSGGGIFCYGGGVPFIINNTVVNNRASMSGVTVIGGAGIASVDTSPVVANNLIAFCSDGIELTRGNPVVGNNCLFGNSLGDYTDVPDQTGTNGNISVDPLLVSTNDYHLGQGSPCIDAGDDGIVQSDWFDADGQVRRTGIHVDIGADEFGSSLPFVLTLVSASPTSQTLLRLTGESGHIYVFESSQDLAAWHVFSTNQVTNLSVEVLDPAPLDSGASYYRAVAPIQ